MQLETLHQIGGRATSLDADIDFYQNMLGAKFIAKYDPPGLIFFNFCGTRLLLELDANPATLYFRVDDIEAAHQELLHKGVTFEQAPHLVFNDEDGTFGEAGAEEWMAFFKDPSGNTLALASRKQPQ